jgi:flagellum-specific peptidoglycan hydrolase FlgJ
MALQKSAKSAPTADAALRSAIVNVARHFLHMAERKTPAEMEAIIWRHASVDGADHGPSCAAFASLTLELGSHVAGYESWVTGGTSYPWPLHAWADARVDPNPASPNVLSVLQDAQNHGRWHPLGDGYDPQPGDWVLFDGHVEVVTNYDGGVLHTIGGDSLPNYSVNAHSYRGPLTGQGVAGFVDNGLQWAAAAASGGQAAAPGDHNAPARAAQRTQGAPKSQATLAAPGAASPDGAQSGANASGAPVTSSVVLSPRAIQKPATVRSASSVGSSALAGSTAETSLPNAGGQQAAPGARQQRQPRGHAGAARDAGQPANVVQGRKSGKADIPGTVLRGAPAAPRARPGQAEIPGLLNSAPRPAASPQELAPYQRHQHSPAAQVAVPGSPLQRSFIEQVAPGAMATQRKYGVPASVTIAQAIDESAWGQSILATQDHNLFGIKGTGPAGSDLLPTQEFSGGQLVDTTSPFRVYNDIGQSIEAHGKLLARSAYFTNAMANRRQPNAFAAALTGVYATDPGYGTKLIQLMQQYNLYRFNVAAAAQSPSPAPAGGAAIPGVNGHGSPARGRSMSASAAQPGSGQAGAGQATLTPERAPNTEPTWQQGGGRGRDHAARPGSTQRSGGHGAAARQGKRAGSANGDWPSDSAIPGTGYPVPTPRQRRAAAHQAAVPGQADIPGVPGMMATLTADPAHRTRIAPRLGQAGPRASEPRPGLAVPVGAAAARGGHQGSSRPSAAPRRGTPGWAVPGPGIPGPATPRAAKATGRAPRGPLPQGASPGEAPFPGLVANDVGQPAVGQTARTTPGFGDALIPGLPPMASDPTAAAAASGALPQDGAAPRQGPLPQDGAAPRQRALPQDRQVRQQGAVPHGGARIPGLAGASSASGGHAAHRGGAARRGHASGGAGHGTNLSPTRARRFASAGQPSAQHGHGAAAAGHGQVPAASGAAARGSAHRPAVSEAVGSMSANRPTTHGRIGPVSTHQSAAPAVGPATATVTAPPASGAMPGQHGSRAGSNRGSVAASASPASPSGAPGPAPTWGADLPSAAPAAPTSPPTPSPASGGGTTYGSGELIRATTTAITTVRYSHHLPPAVGKAYLNSAKVPLVRGEPLYLDVAGQSGISWEILAACDWMQCKAKPGLSPVYGEKLGTVNPDGTRYRTRSSALERCAYDLVELARSVYQLDLTRGEPLSVRELANAFAAFRWGGLLKEHHTSAMEFPYSVAGLTTQHMHMRWPNIDNPQAPDKPGARFHQPFGAVPLVLSLSYPAMA